MRLNYFSQGDGPTLVLIHGMYGSASNLRTVSKAFSDRFRVISMDLRNHGDSPHQPDMDLACMAGDVLETLDAINVDMVHILGHSLGGKIAMQLALNHPQMISKLVVADIAPVRYRQTHSDVLDGLIALENAKIRSRREADEILSSFEADQSVRGFLLTNLVRRDGEEYVLRLNVTAIANNYYDRLMAAPEGEPFTGPTLFIKGQDSAYIQEKHGESIESFFPCADLQVIPGVGHWLHVEDPLAFNNMVSHFIS